MEGFPPSRPRRERESSRFARRLVVGFSVTFATFSASAAAAEAARVALVHDPTPNALQQKTVTRLRAELVAAGFDVTEVARAAPDAREAAEAEPPVNGVFATIVIVPHTPDAADIWVADRITQKTVVRRVQVGKGTANDAAAILAVRAVELLQACLLESIDSKSGETAPSFEPVPAAVSAWMNERQTKTQPKFGLEVGLGVLHSFGGIGPAALPLLGFSYRWTSAMSLGFRTGASAWASHLDTRVGNIAARQAFGALDLAYELASKGQRVRPVALLGAGAYALEVAGTASSPYEGRTGHVFAEMVEIGLGAEVPLGPRVSLLTALRALFMFPKPFVRAADDEVASVGRPSLLGEAAVHVRF